MSDINKKVQIDVTANGQQAKQEFASTANAAKDMSSTIAQAGGAAASSIDKIGDGAGESAQKVDRASKSMIASIQRATAATQAGGQSTSAYFDAISKQRGLNSDALKPYIDQLRAAEAAQEAARSSLGRTGVTAAQTAAALRGVPAQFTDIATSLASGQAPLTVFLQQGGQLKDMFGGAGAAAKALGGYVASLVTPFTVAAAAIGGVGYAAYAGSTEMDEFKKNLILTGNTSGITTDKFNAMAASMANISGITRGAAAEALTAMAASGNIGADAIERLTRSAIQFEKAGGQAVADSVKQFEELGKSPLDASVKLSEKTHYLTLAVYEQIKALEDQGRVSEAAAVAQKAWADAIEQRTPQMVQNIGLLESAWKEMAGTAALAWDTLKGVGRDDTTTEDKITKLKTRLTQARADLANPARARFAESVTLIEKELADLEQRTDKAVAKRASDAEREKQRIAATAGADKIIESQRSKREQYSAELKKLDDQRAKDLLSQEKYEQAKSALAKKYEEKAKAAPKRTEADRELARMAKLDADEAARRIASSQRVGEAMAKETDAIWAKVDAERAAQEAIGLSKSEIEARTQAVMQEQLAWRQALGLEDDQTEQLRRNITAQKALVAAAQGTEARQASFDAAKDAAKEAADAHKRAAEEAVRAWEKTVDKIDDTFHDAFSDMIKSGKADWESFTDSLATTFKTAVADEIYKMTLKPLVLNVVGSFSGAGAPAVPGADGQPISLSNGFGVLSGVQAAWAGVSGGITNAANSFALSGMGQAAGLSTVSAMGPPTAAGVMGGPATVMTGAGATFAAAAAPALGALTAAYAISEMQKSGWGIDNDAKSGALAAVSVGTLGANVILDRLFGHNRNVSNDAQGIQGTFDLTGFTGENFQEKSQKGGTFSKDRRWTDYSAIGSDMDKALDSMLKQAVSGVQTIGKALNVETENALQGFSHTFALQLSENGDMSKAGEKIAAELKKVQDELATRLVPNISDFARYGESASDTFSRLNQEVAATDAILLAMGKNANEAFGAVGLASVKAREDLIDLAGGLESLASKTQSFYANFYTGEEQMALAAKQAQKVLTEGFAELGQSIPATREAFRALVESQDLSTESGRKLWNSLLDLSDEFDTVQKLADTAAESLKTAQQAQATLFDTFAADGQKLDAAKKLVSDTFSSIGKDVPASAAAFLQLSQSIDPATEAGQSLITTLNKISNAFAYVQTSAASAATAISQARSTQRSVVDSYDQSGAVARAQADIAAAFGKYGATAPTDQAGLAAVANSIDVSTELGRQQMTELNALTGAFNTVFSAKSQASGSQRSLQDSFDPTGAVERAKADIAAAFGKYGATVPTDRAGVSAVAGSIDTSTALGREQMAALQSLSGAFETVFSAQEAAAKKLADDATSAADIAKAASDKQIQLAERVHDSISAALSSLLGQSKEFETQSRQMAQATLQSALVIAKAGGSLANFQGLDAALASVSKLDKATFATAAGYAVEFGRTANLLTQLEQYTRINGSHENGLDYVPFDGYVAQLHKGERVQTAASAAAADATVAEVKALRSDLNAIGAALATYTQKTAKLMAKFDVEGIYTRA